MKPNIWIYTYYTLFSLNRYFQKIINNLVFRLFDIPAIAKLYAKRGITSPKATINKSLSRTMTEMDMFISDSLIILLAAILITAMVNALSCIIHCIILSKYGLKVFIIIGLSSVVFNYIVLWHKNKYKPKFTSIDAFNHSDKNRFFVVGGIVICLILVSCILSFHIVQFSFH